MAVATGDAGSQSSAVRLALVSLILFLSGASALLFQTPLAPAEWPGFWQLAFAYGYASGQERELGAGSRILFQQMTVGHPADAGRPDRLHFISDPPRRQQLLEELDLNQRLRLLIQFLREEGGFPA